MRFMKNYSYPFFLAISGTLATIADVLQNQIIAYALISILLVIAATTLISNWVPHLRSILLRNLPGELGANFSALPFSVSCVVLAGLVGGFSALSARAEDRGGVISSSFPEIRQIQENLGIIHSTIADIDDRSQKIEKTTDFLAQAANQWISIVSVTWVDGSSRGESNSIGFSLENNTSFVYEDVRAYLDDSSRQFSISEGEFMIGPDGYEHANNFIGENDPIEINFCLSAIRGADGAHLRELRTYGSRKDEQHASTYRLIQTSGLELITKDEECGPAFKG